MKWSFVATDLDEDEDEIDGLQKLKWFLALLRAQYWSYQQSHWIVRGDASYGNHLMFERLYNSVTVQIDTLAEKIVGIYGIAALDSEDLLGMFLYWNERWDVVDCLHRRGLTSEKDLQEVIKDTYDDLEECGQLTLGMDDFLMAVANEHETNQYLLRQVLRTKSAMQEWKPLKKD
jgi:DNA-binding ferritin-like protein